MSIDKKVAKAELNATLSSCGGLTGEACLTDSAVIILFANMLGAGSFLSLMTTAVLPFLNGLLLIPLAGIAVALGSRRLVLGANMAALCGYFLVVLSPFFVGYEVLVLLLGLGGFAVCQSGFVAGWFPLLDGFLLPERRVFFLGRMRFFHQLSAVTFLTVVSLVIGKSPTLSCLQLALVCGAFAFALRLYFIWRMPIFPEPPKQNISRISGLKKAISDRKLTIFSLYMLLFNLSVFCVIPVTLLYLKGKSVGGTSLVFISAIAFAGMMLGYLLASPAVRKLGDNRAVVAIHIIACLILVGVWIFMLNGGANLFFIAPLLFGLNFCIAANSVLVNGQMLRFATPENRCMILAYAGTFYYGGAGLSRLLGAMWSCQIVLFVAIILSIIGFKIFASHAAMQRD